MHYTVTPVVCGAYQENAYLLCPEGSAEAALIDPGDGLPALRAAVSNSGRRLTAICLTHGHFDHLLAAEALIAETGAALYASAQDAPRLNDAVFNVYNAAASTLPCPESLRAEILGDRITLAGIEFAVLPTPGHTAGSVCLYDSENARLFSGDTLFQAGFGRTDMPGGSMRALRESLRMLFTLPGDTRVFTGHGAPTSIGEERGRYGL